MRIQIWLPILMVALNSSAMAATYEYEVKPVNFRNLVATLYLPKTNGKAPVVVAFGGSEGGMITGDGYGKMLAPQGVAVLALAYFKAGKLPPRLAEIPMEYFVSSVDYLRSEPLVDSSRIGVVSGSRGSEAALLLASMDDRIKSVVVTAPSNVSWLGAGTSAPAWTLAGKAVPSLKLELDETAPKVKRFEAALENKDSSDKATIPIERINGPIFVVSAKEDEIWPSYQMSLAIESYLNRHHFKYSVTHASYLTGHAFSAEVASEIKQSIVDHFVRTLAPIPSAGT
jgi:dienelactone hydrolase